MENKKVDITKLLKDGESVWIKPQGSSMYPLIVEGRDSVLIVPLSPERKDVRVNDILLFRREGSILVLHRVVKKNKQGVYFVGDNQKETEGPIKYEFLLGKVEKINRNGHMINVNNIIYKVMMRIWLFLRPVRPMIAKTVHVIKVKIKRI
ncbi:MAG: S26 family signal peptidase [Lachnospiraceae bacterium]|nr:S26 family signal peptidase [Lachnospiraceae bacterium]